MAEVQEAFRSEPDLAAVCGPVREAVLQAGLSNRVYRIDADKGAFFLRLPRAETAGMVDRHAEAGNIARAAALGIALPPLFCNPVSGILVTRAVEADARVSRDLPSRLGAVIGRLHGSGTVFSGRLNPKSVLHTQIAQLGSGSLPLSDAEILKGALHELEQNDAAAVSEKDLVPSHGDLSPGNCLSAHTRLWLIDWEYSAMSEPAWDLAYTILEHGFSNTQEDELLEAYRHSGGAQKCPGPRKLEIMKAWCDAVSSLWALEQLQQGSDKTDFLAFARARWDRALVRIKKITR